MTTLSDRPATALMVIDVQQGVVGDAPRRDEVVANIGALVERARRDQVPVVWVQHSGEGLEQGSDGWQYVPELVRSDTEPLVHKTHGDSFEATDLENVLAAAGIGHLVVAGAESDACIRSTIHGAFTRGYDVTLVGDAHTAGDKSAWGAPPVDQVIAHTNLYWQFQTAPGRTAAVVETTDVTFSGVTEGVAPVSPVIQ
jgi:nicotinamidase-related amidase